MVQQAVGIHIVPISVEDAKGLFEETTSITDFFFKFINDITKCMSSLKILIGFSQILSVMDLNFSVQWPSAFLSFSSVLAVANLDVFQSINVDCLTSTWTYYSKFHVIIIIPLVLFLLQLILWWIRVQMTTAQEAITTQHVKGWLFFLFLIYPTVSSGTLKVWHCVEVEGEEYLSADFRITCKGPEYELNVILAFVAFLIYVVGIPASLLAILWTHKDHLYEKEGELPRCPPGYRWDKETVMCVPKTAKDAVGNAQKGKDKELKPGNGAGYNVFGNSGYNGGFAFEEPPTPNDTANGGGGI